MKATSQQFLVVLDVKTERPTRTRNSQNKIVSADEPASFWRDNLSRQNFTTTYDHSSKITEQ